MRIKGGDLVYIVDTGKLYTTNKSFFEGLRYYLPYEYAIRYAWNSTQKLDLSADYTVLFIDDDKALISKDSDYAPIYLIGIEGIRKTIKQMTLKEIEKELGYAIELVEETKND